MSIIKKLTTEEKELKTALEKRVLSLYREMNQLEYKKETLLNRINHLEKQIDKVGGKGIDIDSMVEDFKLKHLK
jgi:uncharacterized protein YlxW (UPF0749 family)